MITDRDVVLQVLAMELDPKQTHVSEVCSAYPVTGGPREPLDRALRRMAKERVRRLPVVTDGRLVGILAQADVARIARPQSKGILVEKISEEG